MSQAGLLQIRVEDLVEQMQVLTRSREHVQESLTAQLEEERRVLTGQHLRELQSLQQLHSNELASVREEHQKALAKLEGDCAQQVQEKEAAEGMFLCRLAKEHRQWEADLASKQRSEAAKHRHELLESFLKLQQTTDLNLCLSDCLREVTIQLAEVGTSLELIADETWESILQLEDGFALQQDVSQRKLEALSYCLERLEQQWSTGSRTFEKLLAVCRCEGVKSSMENRENGF